MNSHRAAAKIENQFRRPNLDIHKIVNVAIELGCTDTVEISRKTLLDRLSLVYGEREQEWDNRLAQAFSNDGHAYGQYFCRKGAGLVFHPAVWASIKQVGWSVNTSPTSDPSLPEKREVVQTGCVDSEKHKANRGRNSLQMSAWGTFGLEIIGSSTPHKEAYFRADVSVERLESAVKAGASFIFVYVNNGTRAFAIPAHYLHEACISHNVSVNRNGTPRYELYINHKKALICKNAGPEGMIAAFPESF